MVVAVGALLKVGAFQVDEALSARPVAKQLALIETHPCRWRVFDVRRETEYGLAFYRDQTISRYEAHAVPFAEHLVVRPTGSAMPAAQGRRSPRSFLGTFEPQKLDYYWVAGAKVRELRSTPAAELASKRGRRDRLAASRTAAPSLKPSREPPGQRSLSSCLPLRRTSTRLLGSPPRVPP